MAGGMFWETGDFPRYRSRAPCSQPFICAQRGQSGGRRAACARPRAGAKECRPRVAMRQRNQKQDKTSRSSTPPTMLAAAGRRRAVRRIASRRIRIAFLHLRDWRADAQPHAAPFRARSNLKSSAATRSWTPGRRSTAHSTRASLSSSLVSEATSSRPSGPDPSPGSYSSVSRGRGWTQMSQCAVANEQRVPRLFWPWLQLGGWMAAATETRSIQ